MPPPFVLWFARPARARRRRALGREAEAAGRLEEACRHYRAAIALDPGHAAAHLDLGIALEALGDAAGALAAYEAALALEPSNPYAHYNLGKARLVRGEHAGGEAALRAALAAKPDFPEAHVVLASMLEARGDLAAARASLERAVALRPDFAGALRNLGMLHAKAERRPEAVDALSRAVQADPADAAAQLWLGNVIADLGRREESRTHLEQALRLAPGLADAHVGLGNLHAVEQRFEDAAQCYRRAIELDAGNLQARVNLGNALVYLGEPDAALAAYDAALALDPEHAVARWSRTLCRIPAIRDGGADLARMRAALGADLARLDEWFDARRSAGGHLAVGVQQPFWLAYQAEDNRELLAAYGRLSARLMGEWQARAGLQRRGMRRPGPIRVGVVSQYFHHHSVWNALVKGWFQELDRERFALQAFCLAGAEDDETRFARARAARFAQGPKGLREWAEDILEAQPDVLIYPEIGMDPMTVKLASLRLAPLQAATWGHPETSGLPTVDAFLSAQALEPPGAQDHYTERVVALPGLGCYVEPGQAPAAAVDPARWGLGAQPLLLCPGTPFKYAPEHDRLLVEVARALPEHRLVFFVCGIPSLSEKLRRRLAAAFAAAGLAFERHASFIPWLPGAEFYGLMRRADAMLDTLGFSGFNTALQALECALPLVTCEGRFLRGRLASGVLRLAGLDELVAADERDYVARVERLARDAGYREGLRRRIEAQRHTLYRDRAPIRALEAFLQGGARA